MARKRALVVDDSKSARMVLRKMLERHGLEVKTAESGEQALDLLQHSRPDIIFMDHMMPGMDGFQAVRAVKADPRTATIPVMMYTSKEGDAYADEARALGAIGVLAKDLSPADVARVLERLHLLPEVEPIAEIVELPSPPLEADGPNARVVHLAREAAEDAVQRFLGTRLEELRQRLREELADDIVARLQAVPEQKSPRRRPGLIAVALLLALAIPLGYWALQRSELATPVAAVGQAPAVAAAGDGSSQVLRTIALQRMRADGEKAQLLKTLEWALNRAGHYDFGQLPFGDERLVMVNELISRLDAAGFQGLVRLEAHVGRFCVVRDSGGEARLPPPSLPLQRCDSLGLDSEQSLAAGGRESVAFANFVASSPLLAKGNIRLETVSLGDSRPIHPYPSPQTLSTAGQWNAIASRNQRVQVSIIPSP